MARRDRFLGKSWWLQRSWPPMVVKSRWRAQNHQQNLGSCCCMIPTYPSVAVCCTLPAVVGNSAVCLNDFLWQRRRNLVGMSQGQPQFKALNWMPQRHPCCHVQEDNAIFEHLCQPGLFCETSQDEFSDRFQLPRTMGLVEATQGFHAVDQRPMCCDKVCLCVHVQCNCLHSSKAIWWNLGGNQNQVFF